MPQRSVAIELCTVRVRQHYVQYVVLQLELDEQARTVAAATAAVAVPCSLIPDNGPGACSQQALFDKKQAASA